MSAQERQIQLSETQRGLIAELMACAYEMSGQASRINAASHLVPKLFVVKDLESSSKLFDLFARNRNLSTSTARYQYYPELFSLLAISEATVPLRRQWVSALLGQEISKMPEADLDSLASSLAAVGALGFSFPTWRFLSQKVKLPSGTTLAPLLEIAGMKRLFRSTDKFPSTADKGGQDWLGAGYCREVSGFYIEYRRSYLAILDLNGRALVIRNSSFYFGRDVLKDEAYISTGPISKSSLQNITPLMLEDRNRFMPLTDPELYKLAGPQIVTDLCKLTQALLKHDAELFSYLADPTSAPLFTNLTTRLRALGPAGLPVLALIEKGQPPWAPKATLRFAEATPQQLSDFAEQARATGMNLVLLSGEKGDFPIS